MAHNDSVVESGSAVAVSSAVRTTSLRAVWCSQCFFVRMTGGIRRTSAQLMAFFTCFLCSNMVDEILRQCPQCLQSVRTYRDSDLTPLRAEFPLWASLLQRRNPPVVPTTTGKDRCVRWLPTARTRRAVLCCVPRGSLVEARTLSCMHCQGDPPTRHCRG